MHYFLKPTCGEFMFHNIQKTRTTVPGSVIPYLIHRLLCMVHPTTQHKLSRSIDSGKCISCPYTCAMNKIFYARIICFENNSFTYYQKVLCPLVKTTFNYILFRNHQTIRSSLRQQMIQCIVTKSMAFGRYQAEGKT